MVSISFSYPYHSSAAAVLLPHCASTVTTNQLIHTFPAMRKVGLALAVSREYPHTAEDIAQTSFTQPSNSSCVAISFIVPIRVHCNNETPVPRGHAGTACRTCTAKGAPERAGADDGVGCRYADAVHVAAAQRNAPSMPTDARASQHHPVKRRRLQRCQLVCARFSCVWALTRSPLACTGG